MRCWVRAPEGGASPAAGHTAARTPAPQDRRPPALRRGEAETERLVAAVWQDVLGCGELDGDYFALGGTSIAGINVPAAAGTRPGRHAHLRRSVRPPHRARPRGPPHRPAADGQGARRAADDHPAGLAHLLARHEPLRYRFPRNSLGWRIDRAEPGAVDVFDSLVLPPLGTAAERDVLTAGLEQLRTLVDLERGPALRVRHYDRGYGRPAWLVLLVHHFVFDTMSTVVLIDELDTLLGEVAAGRRCRSLRRCRPGPTGPGI